LTGVDDQGNVVNLTTTSDVDGNFSFTNLRNGTYSLSEVAPAGWTFSGSQAGNAGGTQGSDVINSIVLGTVTQATGYYFGFVGGGMGT
jgi:hypothetical protein